MKRILVAILLLSNLSIYAQSYQDQINDRVRTATFTQTVQNLNDLIALRLTQSQGNTLYKSINYVPTWTEILLKPNTFTPSAHTHSWVDLVLDASHRFVSDAQIASWNSQVGTGFDGNYNSLSNRPTGVSYFTNDANYTSLSAAQASFDGRYLRASLTYSNPDWIGSLDASKITQSAAARFVTDGEKAAWNNKQNALGFTPYNATNPSGYQTATDLSNGLAGKQNVLGFTPYNATNPAGYQTAANVTSAIAGKQDALVSGTNIKTVNGTSLLGSGNITISGGTTTSQADIRAAFSAGAGLTYSQADGIFLINNGYINTLLDNRLKSFDGYDPAVSKVLSTTGTSFRWVTGVSSGTGTGGVVTAQSPRDTALLYADSTQSRVVTSSMTSVTIATTAQLRSFLTTAQTNKNATVLDAAYNDAAIFEQTANWTNVWIHPQTTRGATIQNNAYSTAWIFTGNHSLNRVKIDGFVFKSNYNNNGTSVYPVFWSNELVAMDGLEITNCEITSDGIGSYNGWNMAQYSTSSNSGATAKNIWFHANYVHDLGRANEVLSQGYDYPRIIGLVISNNRFERMGLNDQYGFGMSKSGFIKGILEINNKFVQNRRICSEFVNTQYAISMNNSFSVTGSNVVTGYGISDDNVNNTKYIFIENNTMVTTGRPFYIYGSHYVTFTGGTYTGNYGADMTGSNNTFKNMTMNIYDKVSSGGSGTSFAWQIDVASSNNLLDNVNVSSSNTIANGGLYAREVIVIKGSNNVVRNSIFTQGKQQNGTYYGFIIANSGTGNDTSLNNQQLQGL